MPSRADEVASSSANATTSQVGIYAGSLGLPIPPGDLDLVDAGAPLPLIRARE